MANTHTNSLPSDNNPFVEFRSRYYHDPCLFVQEVLGAEPDDWQRRFLNAIGEGKRKISVRSGHGVGKSTTTSWAAIWHFYTRFPQKTVITAPTSAQLYDALYSELKAWMKKMPDVLLAMADIKTDRIEFGPAPEESFISLRTSRQEQPEALQGVHSENVLLIGDEASGIPEAVFEAASGSMSGHNACTILLGNPTRSSGFFYQTHCGVISGEWFTLKVDCHQSVRVSKEYIQEQALLFGEDSNAFRIRVLGEFPLSDDDTVIPMHLIESAIDRDVRETPDTRPVWGLDVARFGTDRTALCIRHGNVVRDNIEWWSGLDTMQTVGKIKHLYDNCTYQERPLEILVDVIGLGAGVVDRGREMGLPVRGVNVSEAPALGDKYINLRAELWYKCREWLETRAVKLPNDNQLKAELATVRYDFQSSGKIKIESKADIRKRGVRSPDIADSLILTFASDAATAGNPASYMWNSKKPLRRNVPRVA
ncbi:DEAD/DEAH box helicase family protein [Burkholderia vietnamiensis]|uniref:DEAD/DEAH box helicase family protein n=1 Tax=Burkholderia vietnamiensis TaxID=60552 RepID=UPI000AFABE5C|nr:DEAD/DEAH box helicase family protein [Burkholderia vietnamiensis]